MRQTGSKPFRLHTALLAATLVAVSATVAWTHLRDHAAANSAPETAAMSSAGTSAKSAEQRTSPSRAAITSKPAVQVRHASATTALPPPGTPLATLYDELKRRADAGDAEAGMRLFHEVHRCIEARQARRYLGEFPPGVVTADHPDASLVVVRDGQAPEIRQVREMTDYIQANGAHCEGATDAQLASFTPLLLQAAQLGDLKALDCYVGTDFDMMEGLLDHPEWIDQYRAQVPGLVESALKRGDWVIVDLLHHAYSGVFDASARGQLFGVDPVMDYRLLRLEQLGATGAFADKLAPMVAAAAKALTPAQAAAADAWANDYYSNYFNSVSNEVSNGANICQITDDSIGLR